jgi:hypothetical protein
MSGCFTVVVITETKIIFISVDYERTSPEIDDLDTGQKVPIRFHSSGFVFCKLYIAEITSMTGFRIWTVIVMKSSVPVATGTSASLSTKIAGIMNMESVFAWWKLGKGCGNFYSSSYVKSNGFTDYIGCCEYCNGHSYYEQRIIESFVHTSSFC